jgi:hypothetical protein
VDCRPGEVVPDLDRYVIQNCVLYTAEDLGHQDRPAIRTGTTSARGSARACASGSTRTPSRSAAHRSRPNTWASTVRSASRRRSTTPRSPQPPPASTATARGGLHRLLAQLGQGPAQGRRVGRQRGHPDRLLRWRRDGPQRVAGGALRAHPRTAGELRDVRLPAEVIEPFGRLVAEAYAAGCEIVTNNLVGAKWWIENDQLALENPAERFWKEVLR